MTSESTTTVSTFLLPSGADASSAGQVPPMAGEMVLVSPPLSTLHIMRANLFSAVLSLNESGVGSQ